MKDPATSIVIGTTKGLVSVERDHVARWTVVGLELPNVPVTAIASEPGDDALVLGVNHGHYGPKLYRTEDRGATFTELATPAHPEPAGPDIDPVRRDEVPASTELIWALEAGVAGDGELWCGTMPGGLFHSTDGGRSWAINEALWNDPSRSEWFGGGFDHPAIHSVVTDPRSPERLVVGVSCGGAWRTTDGGGSWTAGTGMRAEFMPPERALDPVIQDPHRIVRSPAEPDVLWAQHHCGLYRSGDDGVTWTEIPEAGPSTFGFAAAAHPTDPDTAWFVPAVADEHRLPVDGHLVVTRTRDGGESFEVLDRGLPPRPAFDLIYRHALAVDGSGDRLAMGSTTGNVWVSEDQGDSWVLVSSHLPPVNVVQFAA